MLTKEENLTNFWIFYFLANLQILPIHVDVRSGKIKSQQNKWKKLFWFIYLLLTFPVVAYRDIRLLQIFIPKENQKNFVLQELPIHITLAAAGTIGFYWHVITFILWPDVTVTIFNKLFDMHKGTAFRSNGWASKHRRNLMEYSRLELLTISLPFLFFPTLMLPVFLFIYNPQMNMLLFSSLDHQYHNCHTFSILLFIEIFVIIFTITSVTFVLEFQMLYFLKIDYTLEQALIKLRAPTFVLQIERPVVNEETNQKPDRKQNQKRNRRPSVYKQIQGQRAITSSSRWKHFLVEPARSNAYHEILFTLQQIVLSLIFFNMSNASIVFSMKIAAISLSLITLVYSVLHFSHNAFVGCLSCLITFDAILTYITLYDKPFKIPEKMRSIKKELLLKIKQDYGKKNDQRLWFEKTIRSIRSIGVKVGLFHTLERRSTPNFINFILRYSGRMLVTFRAYS